MSPLFHKYYRALNWMEFKDLKQQNQPCESQLFKKNRNRYHHLQLEIKEESVLIWISLRHAKIQLLTDSQAKEVSLT